MDLDRVPHDLAGVAMSPVDVEVLAIGRHCLYQNLLELPHFDVGSVT